MRLESSYHSAHFAHLSRALQNSIKVCLEIQSDGFLSAQIMMAEGEELGEHGGLLHYKVCPVKAAPSTRANFRKDAGLGRRDLIIGRDIYLCCV